MGAALSQSIPEHLEPDTTNNRGTLYFHFLDLPPELRVIVYEHTLVVGKIFYTPDWYEIRDSARFSNWHDHHTPVLSLLRVCKQIYAEAIPIYLAKNLFVLPPCFNAQPPFWKYDHWVPGHLRCPGRFLFPAVGLSSIKKLSIDFTSRSHRTQTMSAFTWSQVEQETGVSFDVMSQAQRALWAHKVAVFFLKRHWERQTDALKEFKTTLDMLELDFTNAYCPLGCCRCFCMDFRFLGMLKPSSIMVLGLRDGEKEILEEAMKSALSGLNEGGVGIEFTFEEV